MKTLIKNGTVVTSQSVARNDILIDDAKIIKIEKNILEKDTQKVIDAKGKYVFPGGIDPHVHMQLSTPTGVSSDDFESGSRAALYGGTTTIIDFVTPKKGQSILEALEIRKKEAEKSLINCYFHITPVEWNDSTEKEIIECIKLGYLSFKVYMAYKDSIGLNDEEIFKLMQVVGKLGGIVTLHCEIDEEINKLRNQLAKTDLDNPKSHALSRPRHTESEAVQKAIEMAKKSNCPIYIVHVSTKEAIELIERERKKGEDIFAETCPQYLLLDDSSYDEEFENSSKFVISPPLRKQTDNRALWDAIDRGYLSAIGTDHCPFTLEQKMTGANDFRLIPNGAGGVEHRLSLLYTYGFLKKRISITKFVDVTSTQAAKIFGLYPQKGEIAVGSDADLIIWNPQETNTISANNHRQNTDINIYEGFKTNGYPEIIILEGKIV